MNKDKQQLPPELVEKMWGAVSKHHITMDVPELSNECAQIAVEYAGDVQKRSTVLSFKNKDLYNENFSLKQQRDELLEFVIEVMETTTDKTRYNKAKQLINNIDGK